MVTKTTAKAKTADKSVAAKRNALRAEAEKFILDKYRDEFNAKADEVFAREGLTFNRRLTQEERDERKVQALLDANPALRDRLAAQLATASGPVPDEFGTTPVELEQHSGSLELEGKLDQE